MDAALLKYPKKSHRKIVNIPSESNKLAELLGIQIGDGGINNPWQLSITLNAKADIKYSKYINNLIWNLFEVKAHTLILPRNTLRIIYSSITIVDFMIAKGLVRGNKITQRIATPKWILENDEYERAFVRGLVDTDGCLYIHKHKVQNKPYKNIGFCFTSYSNPLILSVANILRKNNINPHINNKMNCIYLYSVSSIIRYLEIFGSSNPRIWKIFNRWRDARVA